MTENVTRLFGGDGDLRPDTQLPIDDIVDGDTDPQGHICAAVMLMQRLGKLRFELQVQAQKGGRYRLAMNGIVATLPPHMFKQLQELEPEIIQVRLATSCCSLAQAYDDDGVPF